MASKLMLVLTLLVACCAAASVPGNPAQERIVGGTPSTIEQFPYIVALVYTYTGPGITVQRCVGSLISSWHVLTSGFCFTGAIESNMFVRAGSSNSLSGGTAVLLNGVTKHPSYLETPRQGDIAVVLLSTPLGISNTINVLYLPPGGTYIPDGQETKIVSWGFEFIGGPQLEQLKTVNLNKISLADCLEAYAGDTEAVVSASVICASAAGKGMCSGDSGAPMVIGQTVVGLFSYFDECGGTGKPDIFTRIDPYTDWILSVAVAPGKDGVGARVAPAQL